MGVSRNSLISLQDYIQSLVTYAEQKASVMELTTLRDSLFARMNAGQGKTLVNSSPGGKSFQFDVTMTVEEQFSAVVKAIDIYNADAGSSPVTFPDLSLMR